jgi:hypothetical protein
MWRPIFFSLLALSACHGNRGDRLFAVGSLELLPEAFSGATSAAQIDALLATEVERLKIDGLSAKRRGGSTILDVTSQGADALERCNQGVRRYLDRRMEGAVILLERKLEVLSEELEKLPPEERASVKEKIRAIDEERHLYKRDARLMAPCKLVAL